MSKLLKLLEWVTVPQAARHLSLLVGEAVSEADVLRLALDRKIALSVNFVNHATALRGRVIPLSEAKIRSGTRFISTDPPYDVLDGVLLPDCKRVLELGDDPETLSGVWDLPMLGCEVLDVEHRYQKLTDGPDVTLHNLHGAFVEREGNLFQLQEHFKHILEEKPGKSWPQINDYFPAPRLPHDAVFVVRTAELTRFQFQLSEVDDRQRKATAPADPRSENTYLTIIGALVELLRSKTPAGKPQSVFDSQAAIIDALLVHHPGKSGITKTTLESKFAEAKRRLYST